MVPSSNRSTAYASLFAVGLSAAAVAGVLLRRAPVVRPRLDLAAWERMIPPQMRSLFTPQTVEEIVYKADRSAQGLCLGKQNVTLNCLGEQTGCDALGRPIVQFTGVRRSVGFKFTGDRRVLFFHWVDGGRSRSVSRLEMVLPESPSTEVDLHEILVRTPEGAITPWKEYAARIGFGPRRLFEEMEIPLETGGVIQSTRGDSIVLPLSTDASLHVDYNFWNHIYRLRARENRPQLAKKAPDSVVAVFHSHPFIDREGNSIKDLLLLNPEDMNCYLGDLRARSDLIHAIIAPKVQVIFLGITIPRSGVTVNSARLRGLAEVAWPRGSSTDEGYLREIRRCFDQYLVSMVREGDRIEVHSVIDNPSIRSLSITQRVADSWRVPL